MSQVRLQIFPITVRGLEPALNEENQNVIFITTGVQSGVTYVLLDSIKQYFGGNVCNETISNLIPANMIRNLGGVGGLESNVMWSRAPVFTTTTISDLTQFTTAEGVMSLCPGLENITKNELEIFCIKVFPDFTIETDNLTAFKSLLNFVTNIHNLTSNQLNFKIQDLILHWLNTFKASERLSWLKDLLNVLCLTPMDELHRLLPQFIGPINQNQIELHKIVILISNLNSFVRIDKNKLLHPINNNVKMEVFSYTPPLSNPLQTLLKVQISRISNVKVTQDMLNFQRKEALQKILANLNFNKHNNNSVECIPSLSSSSSSSSTSSKNIEQKIKSIDFGRMFIYPNPTILKFNENQKGIRFMNIVSAYTTLFMEIANRDLYNENNVVCSISIHRV